MTDQGARLPAPVPVFEADTEVYWRAAGEGRLLLPQCEECGAYVWIPRPYCPADLAATRWVEASGHGVVYSHTTVYRGERAYAQLPPFVLAYVELNEGLRIMSNVVGCEPAEVSIGMPVKVTFDSVDGQDELAIPRFAPARDPRRNQG